MPRTSRKYPAIFAMTSVLFATIALAEGDMAQDADRDKAREMHDDVMERGRENRELGSVHQETPENCREETIGEQIYCHDGTNWYRADANGTWVVSEKP